jgi:hypothetical protein
MNVHSMDIFTDFGIKVKRRRRWGRAVTLEPRNGCTDELGQSRRNSGVLI